MISEDPIAKESKCNVFKHMCIVSIHDRIVYNKVRQHSTVFKCYQQPSFRSIITNDQLTDFIDHGKILITP
jgi:hypothetical protein